MRSVRSGHNVSSLGFSSDRVHHISFKLNGCLFAIIQKYVMNNALSSSPSFIQSFNLFADVFRLLRNLLRPTASSSVKRIIYNVNLSFYISRFLQSPKLNFTQHIFGWLIYSWFHITSHICLWIICQFPLFHYVFLHVIASSSSSPFRQLSRRRSRCPTIWNNLKDVNISLTGAFSDASCPNPLKRIDPCPVNLYEGDGFL
jgi:hypothetical protein